MKDDVDHLRKILEPHFTIESIEISLFNHYTKGGRMKKVRDLLIELADLDQQIADLKQLRRQTLGSISDMLDLNENEAVIVHGPDRYKVFSVYRGVNGISVRICPVVE